MVPDIPHFSMDQMRQATISFPMFGEDFAINPPAYFTLFGHKIYFYGVIIAIGFFLAVLYCTRRCRRLYGISTDDVIDMLIAAVPLAIICARLYYVVFELDYYLEHPGEIIQIWSGGLAIYGGVIGAVLGVILVCRHKKIPIGAMLDTGALGLLIGQAVGRWGNFMNREAFGWTENVDTLFCRMGLTVPGYETFYVHPTFLYESLWNVVGFLILHFWTKKHRRRFDGEVFTMYVAWYGLGRCFIEGLRTDSLWLIPDVIRVSQLLAGVTCVAAVALLLIQRRRKPVGSTLWVDIVDARAAAAESAAAPEDLPSDISSKTAGASDVHDQTSGETPEETEEKENR